MQYYVNFFEWTEKFVSEKSFQTFVEEFTWKWGTTYKHKIWIGWNFGFKLFRWTSTYWCQRIIILEWQNAPLISPFLRSQHQVVVVWEDDSWKRKPLQLQSTSFTTVICSWGLWCLWGFYPRDNFDVDSLCKKGWNLFKKWCCWHQKTLIKCWKCYIETLMLNQHLELMSAELINGSATAVCQL